MPIDFDFTIAAILRAAVIGLFGGIGLGLTVKLSRRGPMIFLPYAALLAALTWRLSRYAEISFPSRTVAAFCGYAIASMILYLAVCHAAGAQRARLRQQGRLPQTSGGVGFWGHTLRLAMLLGVGLPLSAAVAFVAV